DPDDPDDIDLGEDDEDLDDPDDPDDIDLGEDDEDLDDPDDPDDIDLGEDDEDLDDPEELEDPELENNDEINSDEESLEIPEEENDDVDNDEQDDKENEEETPDTLTDEDVEVIQDLSEELEEELQRIREIEEEAANQIETPPDDEAPSESEINEEENIVGQLTAEMERSETAVGDESGEQLPLVPDDEREEMLNLSPEEHELMRESIEAGIEHSKALSEVMGQLQGDDLEGMLELTPEEHEHIWESIEAGIEHSKALSEVMESLQGQMAGSQGIESEALLTLSPEEHEHMRESIDAGIEHSKALSEVMSQLQGDDLEGMLELTPEEHEHMRESIEAGIEHSKALSEVMSQLQGYEIDQGMVPESIETQEPIDIKEGNSIETGDNPQENNDSHSLEDPIINEESDENILQEPIDSLQDPPCEVKMVDDSIPPSDQPAINSWVDDDLNPIQENENPAVGRWLRDEYPLDFNGTREKLLDWSVLCNKIYDGFENVTDPAALRETFDEKDIEETHKRLEMFYYQGSYLSMVLSWDGIEASTVVEGIDESYANIKKLMNLFKRGLNKSPESNNRMEPSPVEKNQVKLPSGFDKNKRKFLKIISGKDSITLKEKVYLYLFDHPFASYQELYEAFPDANKNGLNAYISLWRSKNKIPKKKRIENQLENSIIINPHFQSLRDNYFKYFDTKDEHSLEDRLYKQLYEDPTRTTRDLVKLNQNKDEILIRDYKARWIRLISSLDFSQEDYILKIKDKTFTKEEFRKKLQAKPLRQIGRELKIGSDVLSRTCKILGIAILSKADRVKRIVTSNGNQSVIINGNFKLSKEEFEKLLWEKNLPELSSQLGISEFSISQLSKDLEIQPPPEGYWHKKYHIFKNAGNLGVRIGSLQYTKEVIEHIVWENTLEECEKKLKLSLNTIRRLCKDLGTEIPPESLVNEYGKEDTINIGKKTFSRNEILQMIHERREGELIGNIAKTNGITYQELREFFNRYYIRPAGNHVYNSIGDIKEFMSHYYPDHTLMSTVARGSNKKVKIKCPRGHIAKITTRNLLGFSQKEICRGCFEEDHFEMEESCREIVETIIGKPFPKAYKGKIPWLVNEKNRPLEIDIYNEKLKLGFEVNGPQHYKVIEGLGMTEKKLARTKKNDICKLKATTNNNNKLIVIPFTVKPKDRLRFIIRSLLRKGITLPERYEKAQFKSFYHKPSVYTYMSLKISREFLENETIGNLNAYLAMVKGGTVPDILFNNSTIPRASRMKIRGLKSKQKQKLVQELINSGEIERIERDSLFDKVKQVFPKDLNKRKPTHNHVLENVLVKDSRSIAVEIPVWNINSKDRNKSLTGHIDLIQVEKVNDKYEIKVMDYKPEGEKKFINSVPQIALYAMLMKKKLGDDDDCEINCYIFDKEIMWKFKPEIMNYIDEYLIKYNAPRNWKDIIDDLKY
ncbi:MAG: hypothetical protein ACFFCS_20105, partial [Candidatus Hodarchaeota archaeon]